MGTNTIASDIGIWFEFKSARFAQGRIAIAHHSAMFSLEMTKVEFLKMERHQPSRSRPEYMIIVTA